MNLVVLKGNLTRDPELRQVKYGDKETQVVSFAIAINRYFKRADGTKDKDTTFIECEAWDSGANTINEIFSKGDPVLVKGSLKVESWKDKDENKRVSTKVRVDSFEKLYKAPPREDGEESSYPSAKPETVPPSNDDPDSDIPF